MESKYLDNVRVFKAFCDENRLMVLETLQNGEECACVLLERLAISQPTLSHHMKILCDSGIVAARKKGKWTYYSISSEGVTIAQNLLRDLTTVIGTAECESESSCKQNTDSTMEETR